MKNDKIASTEDIENKEKRIELYIDFLYDQWRRIDNQYEGYLGRYDLLVKDFYRLFLMLPQGMTLEKEAKYLIEWMDTHNNGVLPENLQQMFNEFLLKRI